MLGRSCKDVIIVTSSEIVTQKATALLAGDEGISFLLAFADKVKPSPLKEVWSSTYDSNLLKIHEF